MSGCAIGLVSSMAGAVPASEPDASDEFHSCPNDLNALILYLEETAQIEGASLLVEWLNDGTAVLRYDDFTQHMWCEDGNLHIDCREVLPGGFDD